MSIKILCYKEEISRHSTDFGTKNKETKFPISPIDTGFTLPSD